MSRTTAITTISLVLCLLTTSWALPRPGGVVIVAQDGSGDYDSIQVAIDDYSSTEIIVMPGRYTENILITKDIVVKAYDGPLTTILDGSRQQRWENKSSGQTVAQSEAIVINKALKVLFQGLCVTNGTHGIVINEDDNVTVENCVFWANLQHGIYIADNHNQSHQPTTHIYNCVGESSERQAIAEHLLGERLGVVRTVDTPVRGHKRDRVALPRDTRNALPEGRGNQHFVVAAGVAPGDVAA